MCQVSAYKSPVVLHMEEFVQKVVPYEPYTADSPQVVKVNKVLHSHGGEAGQGCAHKLRYTVVASNGNHKAMSVKLEFFLFGLGYIRCYVVSCTFTCLNSRFNYLRYRLSVNFIICVVTDKIYFFFVHALHVIINLYSVSLARSQS